MLDKCINEAWRIKELQYLRALQNQIRLQQVNSSEKSLRSRLIRLSAHRRESYSNSSALSSMRSVGADIQWQAWLDQTQYQLNLDLAKLLARREPITSAAKKTKARADLAKLTYERMLHQKVISKRKAENALAYESSVFREVLKQRI